MGKWFQDKNFSTEKRGQGIKARKGHRGINARKIHRAVGILMAAALIFQTMPFEGIAVTASESRGGGLCTHHTGHTPDCGYREAEPGAECTHEHTEDCYRTVEDCIHEHTESCYPADSASESEATPADAGERQPVECTHSCSGESGCITKEPDCRHEHDESCGYREGTPGSPCTFVCEVCNGGIPEDGGEEDDPETGTPGTETGDETKEPDNGQDEKPDSGNECICKELCREDNGSNGPRINKDCPVCGAEGADLFSCKGEKTEVQEVTGEKVITAWEWIDPEGYLTDGMLALPGAGRENPAFAEDVAALLPEKIQAKVVIVNAAEDGEETEEDAEAVPETEDAEITLTGWECASYPEDGAYEGTYTFMASLPEGFVLAEDAAALEVDVELGGAKVLAETVSASYQEASWNGGVTYTTKTADSCTPVADSTEAVTWYDGWYVVNSTVTISEPITVTGAVNLILADGCTLNAEKGIVVPSDASLTIYAQSGGTGTLNATGVFFFNGASCIIQI